MVYASFKIRFIASLLDCVIGFFLFAVLVFYISQQSTLSAVISTSLLSLIILINPLFIFSSVLLTYYFGGSFGKLLTGLRVVSVDDKKLSFKRILFRQTIGYSFSWIFFGLGYLSVIKDEKKQAWHDKTVGSVVKSKNNMFIIGLMLYILLLIASVSLIATSVKNLTKGSVLKELTNLTSDVKKSLIQTEPSKGELNSLQNNNEASEDKSSASQPNPSVKISNLPTHNNFTDNQNKFTLDYPSDWIYQDSCEGRSKNEHYPCFLSPDYQANYVGINDLLEGSAVIITIYDSFDENEFCPKNSNGYEFPCREIEINGIRGYKSEIDPSINPYTYPYLGNTTHFRFKHREKYFDLTGYHTKDSKSELYAIFIQILSTFKFLETEN